MAKEIKINLIGARIEKPISVQKRASRCIQGKCRLSNLGENLSKQLFDDAPTLYLNPTEQLFLSNIITTSDPVATVLGSGDFALESSFHGVKDILTFDINSNQYYMASLKLKGLQNMSYEEYWNFFSDVNSPIWLSPKQYKNLQEKAEKEPSLYAFFDEMMKQRIREDGLRKRIIDSNPILRMTLSGQPEIYIDQLLSNFPGYEPSAVFRTIAGAAGVKSLGSYLESKTAYEHTRKNIVSTNISFIKSDLICLKDMLERYDYFAKNPDIRFQAFYLSNVPEFINGSIFSNVVREQLMPMLTDDGVIAYCCQGTDIRCLNMPDSSLDNLRGQLTTASPIFQNLVGQQLFNSVEAYRTIREFAKVELIEVPTLCDGNGICDKDTYVYVKKR